MGTVPTSKLESKLESYYRKWVLGLSNITEDDLPAYLEQFKVQSSRIINLYGGQAVRAAAMAGFPAPKVIDLSLKADHIYEAMQLTAIQAGIGTGLNPREIARAMFNAGMDSHYYSLERLARTEVTNAYWQHQWDQVEDLDLVMVWSAEESARTCPWCLSRDGLVVKDKTIRDHPNGRCTLLPTLPEDVPLRNTKGRNPDWTRNHPKEGYPLPENKVLNQALRGGMERTMAQSRAAAGAVSGMVSQGWSTAEAARYMLSFRGMQADISRTDKTLLHRTLETYAQELYDGMSDVAVPEVLYRGGDVGPTGISSWTTNPDVASLYALRNGGKVYKMVSPKGLHVYNLGEVNPQQEEYLVFGMPRVTDHHGKFLSGTMDGHTELVTADQAIESLVAGRR